MTYSTVCMADSGMEVIWEMAFIAVICIMSKRLGCGGSGGTSAAFSVTAETVGTEGGIVTLD